MKRYKRSFRTLGKKFRSLIFLTLLSEACTALSVSADAIVGQHCIDNRSVAAIALLSSFFMLFTMAHDMIGSCAVTMIVRRKCEYGDKEASQTLADIVFTSAVVFVILTIIVALTARPFLYFITDDTELIDLALRYYAPILFTRPIMEVLLLIERGYKTEGNIAFFSVRPIISNVLNLVMDVLAVLFIGRDIRLLAYATVFSSLAGYAFSLSYGLRKNCRIHPDFSGILKRGRLAHSLKEQVKIGSAFFYGDIIRLLVTAASNKLMLMLGGTSAMVCFGVVNNVGNIVGSLCNSIISNGNILSNALFVEKDRKGLSMIFKAMLVTVSALTLCAVAAMNLFPYLFGGIYNVSGEKDMQLLRICFACFSISIFWKYIGQFIRTFLISIKKEKYSTVMAIGEQLSILVAILFLGFMTGSISAVWIAMGWAAGIFLIICLLIIRKGKSDDILQDDDIISFTAVLDNTSIVSISEEIYRFIPDSKLDRSSINRVALIVEESSMLIVRENPRKAVCADIRVRIDQNKVRIFIYYDGYVFEAEKALVEQHSGINSDLDILLLKNIISDITYVRVAELNCLEFTVHRTA